MKLSIWDILTGILLFAILVVGGLVMSVFANPYTAINPYPPPKLPPTIVIPSATPTYMSLPATWTPNAETEQAYAALGYTLVPSSTAGPSPTGFTLTFTDTPTITDTPTETGTPTYLTTSTTYVYSAPTTASCSGCTSTPVPATSTPTGIGSASEIHGVKNNTWQKNLSNPSFLLPVSSGMYGFYWYFGLDPNGTTSVGPTETPVPTGTATPTATTVNIVPGNFVPIQHDAKLIDFTPPQVTGCGAYYLRIQTVWASKSGHLVNYNTGGWNTVFTFEFDNTPPIPVYYATTGISGALRGIQNISDNPNFSWGYWNGDSSDVPAPVIPSGDYRFLTQTPTPDDVIYDPIYQCSGIKGYYVYWGPDPQGVDKTHWTTSTSYNPPGVKPNTAYYLRLDSVDKLTNESGWHTVALDDSYAATYDSNPWNPPPPSAEQAAFYYDNVRPNNITGITENAYGYISDTGFVDHSQNNPDFTFSGGSDPQGFITNPIYGYDVIWSTNLNSTSYTFQQSDEFSPLISTSGTYYLKVKAVDWAMNTSFDWKQFVYQFDNVGPSGVLKVSELSGAPNNSWTTTMNSPNFSWDASQVKDPGNSTTSSGLAPGFYVYFGTDPEGTPAGPQPGNTFTPSGEPLSDGVYYLRIMVADNAGNQTVTTPFILKYDSTAPSDPVITEHDIKSNHPTFTWTSSDDTSGVAGYYYYYGTNSGGTSNKLTKTTSLDGKTHSSGSTYYLRVQAKDNAGNLSNWVTTSFTYP